MHPEELRGKGQRTNSISRCAGSQRGWIRIVRESIGPVSCRFFIAADAALIRNAMAHCPPFTNGEALFNRFRDGGPTSMQLDRSHQTTLPACGDIVEPEST